jgi:hypothetical protein
MTKGQYWTRIHTTLNETLEDGPGPRTVVLATTDAHINFIFSEAGANAPAAVEEVIERMRARLRDAIEA